MAKTIDSSEDEILPPLRTRDPYSTSRARMKPSKQRVKSRNDKKNEPAATEAPSMDVRFRSKSKQQHPAEVVVPLSDRDQDRGRVRLGNHDHHLDRDEVTPPSMPREEDFSRIMRKPSKSKKATASTMMSSEPASSSASPSPPPLMPTPFSRVPIHEQFEKDLDSRFMLSQPTTTTTKSPVDRPIRRVSWGAYGLDGNDDPEYDGGFGNQLVRP